MNPGGGTKQLETFRFFRDKILKINKYSRWGGVFNQDGAAPRHDSPYRDMYLVNTESTLQPPGARHFRFALCLSPMLLIYEWIELGGFAVGAVYIKIHSRRRSGLRGPRSGHRPQPSDQIGAWGCVSTQKRREKRESRARFWSDSAGREEPHASHHEAAPLSHNFSHSY